MKRLIEKGLMFGNLIRVDSPAWVQRYNRALKLVTGKETQLAEFHIDLAGYSPEIGDEIGEMDYLNPEGAHRQFILLTTEQKTAPLLNADLSVLRDLLQQFIRDNESQLFSLTARDAVVGEMDDMVWQVSVPSDLLQIGRIRIGADTTGNHVANADRLTALIERFRTEPDAWYDDVLIARMIEQAKETGDVIRNPIHLETGDYEVPDFWTSQFGGVYVFRSPREDAMIFRDPRVFTDPKFDIDLPNVRMMSLQDMNAIAMWMARNALAEPIVTAKGTDAAAILRQKIDFILVDAATRLGIDTGDGTRSALRRAAARMGHGLPEEIRGLSALLRYAEEGGAWPVIDSASPAYFYAIRGSATPARDLINQLLTELAPHDVRSLFIMNKPLFYQQYQTWDEAKKEYVVNHLAREYQIDKQGTRDALFGPEPGMEEAAPVAPVVAGPWGRAKTGATLSESAGSRAARPGSAGFRGPWGG
ncbi:DUF6638 family protein [Paracoccus aerodenitrificans]|uniref:DUF6638 family protein n=1 Tax=Paracoccus aerodenitrificans TaxID=3017781 RepID=UPI0022F13BED|nr:DUF6638 family protein [Paracoccus aerodenitrificans]WBU65271.1 hypothetical protein PAE61_07595 [Paracoccus aerodenitrificans]